MDRSCWNRWIELLRAQPEAWTLRHARRRVVWRNKPALALLGEPAARELVVWEKALSWLDGAGVQRFEDHLSRTLKTRRPCSWTFSRHGERWAAYAWPIALCHGPAAGLLLVLLEPL